MEIRQRKRRAAPTIRTLRAEVTTLRAEWTRYRAELTAILDSLILAAAVLDRKGHPQAPGSHERCTRSPE